MLTQEDLQLIAAVVEKAVAPINERLDRLEERMDRLEERMDRLEEAIEELKEESEITRDVTNSIGEWIDFYFSDERPYPLDKDEAVRTKP